MLPSQNQLLEPSAAKSEDAVDSGALNNTDLDALASHPTAKRTYFQKACLCSLSQHCKFFLPISLLGAFFNALA
jgi:hypothetical protein